MIDNNPFKNTFYRLCIKRLNHEISFFNEKKYFIKENISKHEAIFFHNITFNMYCENKNNNEYYYFEIYYINKLIFVLDIPNDYPFKPYKINKHVFCQDKSYLQYLNGLSNNIKFYDKYVLDFFYQCLYLKSSKFINLNNGCYCCSSIICNGNWSPSIKIHNFLQEYLEFKFIDRYTRKLQYKKIKNIYNNLFNNVLIKIPEEIINHIISFII
tara:strand:+ start:2050 stop:2688 length:639 start_codon:yes stop_codon:yes gene_type:complete